MNDLDKSQPAIQESADAIPWAERITDHNRKIDEYLQNCLFRGCSAETTIPPGQVISEPDSRAC